MLRHGVVLEGEKRRARQGRSDRHAESATSTTCSLQSLHMIAIDFKWAKQQVVRPRKSSGKRWYRLVDQEPRAGVVGPDAVGAKSREIEVALSIWGESET